MVTCFKNSLFNTNAGNCNSNVFKGSNAVIFFIFNLILLLTVGCKQEYNQPVKATETNYLVVEGFINAAGSTKITLSRTTGLKDSVKIKSEQGAAAMIKGEDNSSIPLSEDTAGHYKSDSIILNKNQKYWLYIKTADGREYLSDFVAVKETPPIDSVNWQYQNDGVHIFVNSHDPRNNTMYYKWDYAETWEINSHYAATYKYVRGSAPDGSEGHVIVRDPDEARQMRVCWQNVSSNNINIGSSAKLAADVISLAPVITIPPTSEKISVRYSILVKQYALDKQAYAFYHLMYKNSESLGSIFDGQPTEISGNIHQTGNAEEKVIGYIGISTEQTKRIFITNAQVASHWSFDPQCRTMLIHNDPSSLNQYLGLGGFIPYDVLLPRAAYYSVSENCADCRTRGGIIKPDFW